MSSIGRVGSRRCSRTCPIDNVDMMKGGIQSFYAGHSHFFFLCKLQGRAQKGFDLHGRFPLEIPIHDAVIGLWLGHLLHRGIPKVWGKLATQSASK
jgi:hypothetical protein